MSGKTNLSSNLLVTASLVVLLSGSSVICDPHPWAENVCNTTIPVRKDIVIELPVQYEIKVQSMCGILPCVKTRTETRTDQSIKTILQQVEKVTCCPGYTETPERRCAPICLQSCSNGGKCVAPNTCKCQPQPTDSSPGFVGPTCARFVCLNDNKWGSRCDRPCDCSGNSYCGADTGKCLCYPGWRGPNCTLECDPFSNSDDCQASNRLPPIIEPESNLMSNAYLGGERQRPEALVLDDDVRIIADEGQDWRTLTATSLIGVLSIISFVFIVAFLVIKRRYERIRNELYYSASNYPASSAGGDRSNYSEPPPYDEASSQTSASGGTTVVPSNGGNLGKNFSFAMATRNILLGKDLNSLDGKSNERNAMLIHARVESHLIKSQMQAEQNVYTDVVLDMRKGVGDRPAQQRPSSPPSYSQSGSEDHVYQVPRSSSPSVGTRANLSDLSADETLLPHNVTLGSLDRSHEDDSASNIYEEIKPRK